jgi:hypothetical protein
VAFVRNVLHIQGPRISVDSVEQICAVKDKNFLKMDNVLTVSLFKEPLTTKNLVVLINAIILKNSYSMEHVFIVAPILGL